MRDELETRAGVESLETLHAERRKIIKAMAPLEMLVGSGGERWTAKRRQHRDVIGKLIQAEAGKEVAANKLEQLANADDRHVKFCEETEARYIEYMTWRTALDEVNERIESRLAEMRFATAEARLAG